MSAFIRHGNMSVIFGVATPKPFKGFPEGRVRLRLRNDNFAEAFVKNANGIVRFHIAEEDGFWIPKYFQGANIRREVIP